MSFNLDGFATIMDGINSIFNYLAYGTGEVTDNSTSLVSEIARTTPATLYDTQENYFELQFTIDESTSNGNIITEWGLAKAATGDIASTDTYVGIEKNSSIYITIYVRTTLSNLGA